MATATSLAGTMAADIVGAAVAVGGRNFSVETAWVDVGGAQDPVGQFGVEWSNEYDPITNPSATFTTFTLAAADQTGMAPATTSGRWGLTFSAVVRWVRVRYTRTSGTGTATSTVAATAGTR